MSIQLAKMPRVINSADTARDALRYYFPRGAVVPVVSRHVSRSGMSRAVSVVAVGWDGVPFDASWIVATADIGFKPNRAHGGLTVSGAGMDMHFHVVYVLSGALYGDGYALTHTTL